jgi:transposase InsO family protein
VLTDNGIQFAELPKTATARRPAGVSRFDQICRAHNIEHRPTKPNHPWTKSQVERMNRTLMKTTVKRYHYQTHNQLKAHLATFLDAYNFAKRLNTLRGLPPYEAISRAWTDDPKPSPSIQSTSHRN